MSDSKDDPTEFLPFLMAGSSEWPAASGGYEGVEQSGGFHPDEGQYVIDPDYFEILGMKDPSELIKFHK